MPATLRMEIPVPWITVGMYGSQSNRDVRYQVKLNLQNGQLGCSSPGWRYHGRYCRHVSDASMRLATHPGLIETTELPAGQMLSAGYEPWAEEHLPLR